MSESTVETRSCEGETQKGKRVLKVFEKGFLCKFCVKTEKNNNKNDKMLYIETQEEIGIRELKREFSWEKKLNL